jgi:hypothetical protein
MATRPQSSTDPVTIQDYVRPLPRLATVGMVMVVVLQISGALSQAVGLLDVIVLFVVSLVARLLLRTLPHA